jgi:hypothetical protein
MFPDKSTQQRECFTFLCLGFAESQFNYGAGNEHLGSYVEMYSGTHTYVCDIHVDGCTKKLITCYTR